MKMLGISMKLFKCISRLSGVLIISARDGLITAVYSIGIKNRF